MISTKIDLNRFKSKTIFLVTLSAVALHAAPVSVEPGRVTVTAKATGIAPRSITEFAIVTPESARTYESLFVADASSDDIRKAVDTLGIPRGRAARPDKLQFWPKGERVMITVIDTNGVERPLESFIIDRRHDNAPLPAVGFIYTGVDDTPQGPGSIAALYNEPTTLFDLPRFSPQSDVYERYASTPDIAFAKDEPVKLIFRREDRADKTALRVVSKEITASAEALRECRDEMPPDTDLYLTVAFPDDMTLDHAIAFAKALQLLDTDDGIRIEAPPSGNPYYRALLPNPAWRDRSRRPSQPSELRITPEGTTLVNIREVWHDDQPRPELVITEIPVLAPDALPALLKEANNPIAVLLIFAPGNTTMSTLRPILSAIEKSHANLYLFTE